jgi:hypothetical protein
MIQRDLYKKLLEFVTKCIDDNLVTILIANQNAPNATKPFITVSIRTQRIEGLCITKHETDEFLNTLENRTYLMNATVQIQAFCDDIFQCTELLEKIKFGFDIEEAYRVFEGEIAYVRDLSDIINLPTALDAKNEYRAAYDFLICYNQNISNKINSIRHIEITDEVNNDTIIVDKDENLVYTIDSQNDSLDSFESFLTTETIIKEEI